MTVEPIEVSAASSSSRKRRRSPSPAAEESSRILKTLFLGPLDPSCTAHEVFNALVGHGAVESLRFNRARTAAFIDLVNQQDAQSLIKIGSLPLRRRKIRLEWATMPSHADSAIRMAIKMGATRCLFLSGLSVGDDTCAEVAEVCARWGEVDQVRANRERGHVFAHLSAVAEATEAMGALKRLYPSARISFARDRCTVASEAGEIGSDDDVDDRGRGEGGKVKPTGHHESRTIYLGGVPAECRMEDICNVVRGGALQSIRLAKEKGCAFLTFLESTGANLFMSWAQRHGMHLHGKQLKLGWSTSTTSSSPTTSTSNNELSGPIKGAVRRGATRCLILGNLGSDRRGLEDDLRRDLGRFGPIESIRLNRQRQSATIHFANLLDALKAHDQLATMDASYAQIEISFGRDRCADIPRGMNNHQQEKEVEEEEAGGAGGNVASPAPLPSHLLYPPYYPHHPYLLPPPASYPELSGGHGAQPQHTSPAYPSHPTALSSAYQGGHSSAHAVSPHASSAHAVSPSSSAYPYYPPYYYPTYSLPPPPPQYYADPNSTTNSLPPSSLYPPIPFMPPPPLPHGYQGGHAPYDPHHPQVHRK